MRERLLKKVLGRVDRCVRHRDRTAVLTPEAVAEARALLDTVPDGKFDTAVAYAVGWLFWARFLYFFLAGVKEEGETGVPRRAEWARRRH